MHKKFNPNKLLSDELLIKGADTHLYAIVLLLFNSDQSVKRKLFSNPWLIFSQSILMIIRSIIIITNKTILQSKAPDFHQLIGNFDINYFSNDYIFKLLLIIRIK